jgi:pimeloyl-ACP methyl ester carboxylesterase
MTNPLQQNNLRFSPRNAAQFCVLLADVMDTYLAAKKGPVALTPEILPDSDLATGWDILGYLVANQDIYANDANDRHMVFFGVLAKSKDAAGPYAVLLRGTAGWREWLANCHVGQVDYPMAALPGAAAGAMVGFPNADCGDVEEGFFGIYSSMRYLSVSGGDSVKAWKGIAQAVKDPEAKLYVAGHSMGAALATYLTFDLAQQGSRQACGIFIASPKPGDNDFANAFDAAVAEYAVVDYVHDIVPDLPPSLLGYQSLPRLVELSSPTAQAIIKDEVRSNHHALCYAAMLHYQLKTPEQWKALLVRDDCDADCIQGAAELEQVAA